MLHSTNYTATVDKYTWCIQKYRSVTRKMKNGERLESPCFSIDNAYHNSKWCLHLYPRGLTPDDSDYVSVFLSREAPTEGNLKGTIILSIEGKEKTPYKTNTCDLDRFNKESCQGWREFVKISDLSRNTPKKRLTLELSVVMEHNINIQDQIQMDFILKELQNKLGINFWKDKLSDVVIATSCGSEVPAHKVILSVQSDEFKHKFSDEDKSERPVVHIDYKLEVVKTMLKFVYTQEIKDDLHESLVFDLLSLANDCRLHQLKNKCVEFLEEIIDIKNVKQIFEIAKRLKLKSLKKIAAEFLKEHKQELNDAAKAKTLAK